LKKYTFGNTRVIVHSDLWNLTEEEMDEWVKEETEKGNPVLAEIREAIKDCYRKREY
jgi:hypothetical protein